MNDLDLAAGLDQLVGTLRNGLISASENDRDGDVANLTDGLFAIARALHAVAAAITDTERNPR